MSLTSVDKWNTEMPLSVQPITGYNWIGKGVNPLSAAEHAMVLSWLVIQCQWLQRIKYRNAPLSPVAPTVRRGKVLTLCLPQKMQRCCSDLSVSLTSAGKILKCPSQSSCTYRLQWIRKSINPLCATEKCNRVVLTCQCHWLQQIKYCNAPLTRCTYIV